ncbi:hypothetical protein DFJ58DRAFT_856154 [Suillus subalutaceus]|uniref:uncharacterized protein n=1 Tax=Suillus subalutaceus TaxID=48586 RepID=UPI001B86C4D9|nr:uncharacterized protein DFJ58DRAFT_856154 [Suillus subalutaceus]KAG1841926.1 hypothetical protein DFJ58DRAFT_856154 [Suillus subalutaceus]
MPPRKPQVASHSVELGQETSPEGGQEAGGKAVAKRKLNDGGDVSITSKRGRKTLVQPRTTGGFKNPFPALGSTSAPPVVHNMAPLAHLVPLESIPPHPPQSFDAMLPQSQRYDAYMRPDGIEAKLSERNNPSAGPADVPIDPALEATRELDVPSPNQGYDPDTTRMPPPATNQTIPSKLASAAIIESPFDALSTRLTSTNPFHMLSSTRERSATPQNTNSISPTLTSSSLTLSAAFTTPDGSNSSSEALRVSAANKQGAGTPSLTKPTTGTRAVIPKWLTDTITRLENEMKALKEKQDEATDIIDEQGREIDKLHVEKARTLLDSVSSNVDVITKSLEGSSEPSKSKTAQAVSDNSKDNIWNTGVRKCFLKGIGVTKPSAIKVCHPHDDGVQIKGEQVRPDFSKDWSENALWHTHLVQYIKHNIRSCHPMVSQELLASKTDEDILKRLHENFKYYAAEYRSANKISLTTGKVKGKIDSQVAHREARKRAKLEERNHVRPASSLMSAAWDYAFQLAYQSTDESMPSEDEQGGIDPDTDEEKDVRKKPPAKAKGKRKAPSKEPWITHRQNYRSLLFNQAMDHLNGLALEDKNSAVVIHASLVIHAIESCHPSRYDGSIVMADAPEQAQGLNDEGLADDEGEPLANEDDEDLYNA